VVFLDVSSSALVEILANEDSNLPLGAVVSAMIMLFLTLGIEGAVKARPFCSVLELILKLDLGGGILQDLPWGSPAIVGCCSDSCSYLRFSCLSSGRWAKTPPYLLPFSGSDPWRPGPLICSSSRCQTSRYVPAESTTEDAR
jgi:hypothetical protein